MINERSLAAVGASRLPGGRVRPLYGSYCFSRIPARCSACSATDRRRLPGDVLPELDGGPPAWWPCSSTRSAWAFAERFAQRPPLLARVREDGVVSQLTTQFPSTTTAHVTTLHTLQPVGEHGSYEWFIYEPSLDRIVCPLMAGFAGEDAGGLVAAGADLQELYPQADGLASRLARLGVACTLVQPAETVDTPFTRLVCGGARARRREPSRGRRGRRAACAGGRSLPHGAVPRRLRRERPRVRTG